MEQQNIFPTKTIKNMESSYELDPEILDSLYKHQLKELREFTLKLDDTQDINLCRKWLQVFNKTSEDEKISRNCLCALLCQQLKNDGCLSMPFTDLSNCNRDLTQVLATLDQSFSNESNSLLSSRGSGDSKGSMNNLLSQENEIVKLKRELHQIQQQRDEKETKIRELTRIIEKCNRCEMENDILKNISDLLENLRREKGVENFWIFSKLFAEENNLDLHNRLTELDKIFQVILQEHTKGQLLSTQKQLTKIIKSREKLLKKYEQELRVQKWQQKMRVKVVKLQFCSILSRIFIRSRQKSQSQMIDLFNELETKYKDILLKFAS